MLQKEVDSVPELQCEVLGVIEALVLGDKESLKVVLLQPLIVLGALSVRLPLDDRVALAHLEAEAQPETEDEALGEKEVESVRLVATVNVAACVVGADEGLKVPDSQCVGLDVEETQELCERVAQVVALLQPEKELGAVVGPELGLVEEVTHEVSELVKEDMVEGLGLSVRLPVEDRVALAHFEEEEQLDTDGEELDEKVADRDRLVDTVAVGACVVGTEEGLLLSVLQIVVLEDNVTLVLDESVKLNVALLQEVGVLKAVVAAGLGLRVRLPLDETEELKHKVEEAQPVTDNETLGDMVADSVRLIVPVGVDA